MLKLKYMLMLKCQCYNANVKIMLNYTKDNKCRKHTTIRK